MCSHARVARVGRAEDDRIDLFIVDRSVMFWIDFGGAPRSSRE
jgi:hypothetical protein